MLYLSINMCKKVLSTSKQKVSFAIKIYKEKLLMCVIHIMKGNVHHLFIALIKKVYNNTELFIYY